MAYPEWCKSYLSESSAARIEESVRRAEEQTSGEIVPMVVRRSAAVGHVQPVLVAILALAFFALEFSSYPARVLDQSPIRVMAYLIILLALSRILSRVPFVQRLLTTAEDCAKQVDLRAEVEFFEHGLQGTAGGTGILLFVSLMEHRAVVLADRAISELLPPQVWCEVIELLLSELRRGDLAAGFIKAIDRCGEILVEHLPRQEIDRDELRNSLIVKE